MTQIVKLEIRTLITAQPQTIRKDCKEQTLGYKSCIMGHKFGFMKGVKQKRTIITSNSLLQNQAGSYSSVTIGVITATSTRTGQSTVVIFLAYPVPSRRKVVMIFGFFTFSNGVVQSLILVFALKLPVSPTIIKRIT